MSHSPNPKRMLLLTEGRLGVFDAKTAVCLMRYAPEKVAGLLDRANAGKSVKELTGIEHEFPIFASVDEAMSAQPEALVIGVAPQGGRLDDLWRQYILDAVQHGLDVYSGLHQMLSEDAEFAAAAAARGVHIWDIRKPPDDLPVGKALARNSPSFRILTMGTDCNVGKMVATFELNRELQRRGKNSFFIATGQTGVLLSGYGMALDRVISDFCAGAAERMVLEHQDKDYLLIEGQGSLLHPGFSGVTLSLLHGSLPHAVILCHHPGREHTRGNDVPVASLQTHIELCQQLCAPVFTTKVIGIAINGYGMSEQALNDEIARAQDTTGLPATDVIRFGPGPLADAIAQLSPERAGLY